MPVHLGSMGESIKMVIQRNPDIRRGDVYVLNDPYHGGTHLPDVTVVTPVFAPRPADPPHRPQPTTPMFHRGRQDGTNVPSVPQSADPDQDEIWFYVAARGHHAEIGGISPGSMPSASTRVEEEGVLIDNWLLVENGRLNEAETIDLLETAMYPSRAPATNLADLRAQIAANEEGIRELHAMVDHFGLDVVRAYMGHVQENAAESVRRVITALHDGHYEYELDNRAKVKVTVTSQPASKGPPRSTSPARPRSSRTTSTRRPAWPWPRCSTCSAPWSTTTSRSTPAACSRSP